MKYKLFALLAASFTLLGCGQDKKEDPPVDNAEAAAKPDAAAKPGAAAKPDVAASKVATSIAPVVQKFEGEKYAPTKLTGNPDYYIMYFTASW